MKKRKLREKTEREKFIAKIIRSKKLPFVFAGGKRFLSDQSFDFIAKDGSKKTIEVTNDDRDHGTLWRRLLLFHKHGWKVLYLDKSYFVRYNSRDIITRVMKNF